MRILPSMSFEEGYEPSPVELNHEEGILEISHISESVVVESAQTVAETLILRCRVRPIPLLNKAIKVGLISEGEVLEDAVLYEESTVSSGYEGDIKTSQWQGIALDYAGVGRGVHQGEEFVFSGTTLPSGYLEDKRPLYVKPFRVEAYSYGVRITTLAEGQVLTSPPGVLNTRVLRGYGGYYQPGTSPAQIEQIYYGLTSNYTQTQVRLYTTSTLQAQQTPPPQGGRDFNHDVIFNPDLQEEEYLSLAGALAAGYARLNVSAEGEVIPYTSYLCEAIPGYPTFVNVYFKA